jgi:hypothetical protein
MFREMGVQSISEAELTSLDGSILNAKVDMPRFSATVGETLILGLMVFNRRVPENVVNVVCGSGNEEMAKLLRESLDVWNRDISNVPLRDAMKTILGKGIADLIVSKDTLTEEDSLRKRLSLQSALTTFSNEFSTSF